MTISLIVNKIVSLLGTLNNPSFFLYRVYHYLNKDVPYGVTKYIYKKNLKDYQKNNSNDFFIETYDGSGQAVHPDIAYMKNSYWMVLTPYPYGMEEYENPCIYHGSSLSKLQVPKAPIAVQHKHIQGVHLSDPCFASKGDLLYCYYRESERIGDRESQKIWEMKYKPEDDSWSEPQLLMHSDVDKILSPAMLFNDGGELKVFYVSTENDKFSLVCETIDEEERICKMCTINGMPDGYELWHLGIKKEIEIDENCQYPNILMGLFLMRSKQRRGMKLFEAKSEDWGLSWQITSEIKSPSSIEGEVLFPYKSCYVPKGKGQVLLSFRDKKSRNRLIIVPR